MRPALRAFLFVLYSLFYILCFPSLTHAASLAVSMSVGLTYFQVEGYTSPNALLYLKENGSTIATASSQSDGSFSITVGGYDGTYTYTLYAQDLNGEFTNSLSMTVALTPGNITTLGNLILPPSYHHNGLDKNIGEDFLLSGMAVPSSDILLISRNTTTYIAHVDSNGKWTLRLSTDSLSAGTYDLILKNQLPSGLISDPTINMVLTLHDRTLITPVVTQTPQASVSPSPKPSPQPWWLAYFDIFKDSKLTYAEMKDIIIKWLSTWTTSLKDRQTGSCDLNGDGICNLTDFSILLYYIER